MSSSGPYKRNRKIGRLVAVIEVKAGEQQKVILGTFGKKNAPKGFAIELNPTLILGKTRY